MAPGLSPVRWHCGGVIGPLQLCATSPVVVGSTPHGRGVVGRKYDDCCHGYSIMACGRSVTAITEPFRVTEVLVDTGRRRLFSLGVALPSQSQLLLLPTRGEPETEEGQVIEWPQPCSNDVLALDYDYDGPSDGERCFMLNAYR